MVTPGFGSRCLSGCCCYQLREGNQVKKELESGRWERCLQFGHAEFERPVSRLGGAIISRHLEIGAWSS